MKTREEIQNKLIKYKQKKEEILRLRKMNNGYIPDYIENNIDRVSQRISELEWVLN